MPVALLGPSGRITLDGPIYTLGSAPDNQIVLTDVKASPRHASLQLQGQSYSLTDLGSADGTYLNEQRIFPHSSAFLKNADKIRIGNSVYTYEESLVSSPSYPSYDPTMLASNSPAYDPTVMASQTPPQPPFTGYGQGGTPSAPNYPPSTPSAPAYGQSAAPGYPPVTPTPAYGQPAPNYAPQVPPAPDPAYGQSAPNYAPQPQAYGQSGANYPPAQPQAYGQSGPNYAPVPPAPDPAYGQSAPNYPPVAPTQAYGQSSPGYPPYAPSNPGFAPVEGQPQQPWGGTLPPGYQAQPPQKKGGGLKIAIILIVILLILGGGGGIAGYILTRPKPVITVTSTYLAGTTPAGATDTSFHVAGTDFTGNSTVSFLIDGIPLPGGQTAESDSNGAISATLNVTDAWATGNHTLTAKDAAGYLTKAGFAFTIVAQGDDKTPGPNGAPTNSASGSVDARYSTSSSITLTITGGSDTGGKVCASEDDGQPHATNGTDDNGDTYVDTSTYSCSGTYVSGKLSYTETTTAEKLVYSDGLVCDLTSPTVDLRLNGTFTSGTDVNGDASSDKATFSCTLNGQTAPVSIDADTGSWTGTFTPSN